MHARGRGYAHLQIIRRDFLHPGVHGPGALLELQLPVFDLQLPGLVLLFLQFHEQFSGFVLRSDQGQRANDENSSQRGIEPDHCATLSATRITALRARGLAVISASVG